MLQVWKSFYARSDPAKAYSLLSPALILVTLAMLIPLGLMLSFSFFTQVSLLKLTTLSLFKGILTFFKRTCLSLYL